MKHHRTATQLTDLSRVVILGASGFIGGALSRRLTSLGTSVVALSSRDLDLTADDADDRLAALLCKDDALVFASAITREKGRDPATMMRNLTMGERVVAALDRARCAHVVYFSSDAVYGDAAPNPVSEATPCNPSDLYGLMHLVREQMLRQICGQLALPLAIIRPSIVYGPGDTHGSYGPNRFFRMHSREEPVTLFGDGEERRDHVYIDDVVELVMGVVERRSEGILNVATGTSPSFADVARAFADVVGGATVRPQPRVVPITHREYDVSALREAFPNLKPTLLEAGLRRSWFAMRMMEGQA